MLKSKNGILTGNTTANTVAWTGQRRVANGSRENSPSYLVPLRTNTTPVFRMTDFRESARVCSAYGRSLCPCLCSGFPVIDDILVFSNTLEDHLKHLRLVLERLKEVNLKLQPAKCRFARKEMEYLGHILTPDGLKPNPALVSAVQGFSVPTNLKELRRFLRLASYYRRFIPRFASIAQPLHHLTCKDVSFVWTEAAASAFEELKEKLTTSPVLAYPSFDQDFVLETDASISGLGAVLAQVQSDSKLHPIAYAS